MACPSMLNVAEQCISEKVCTCKTSFFPWSAFFRLFLMLMKNHGDMGIQFSNLMPLTLFFKSGSVIRGHEFHYSKVEEWKEDQISLVFKVERGFGFNGKRDGLCYKNVLSTYTHIHALGERRWASALVRKAEAYRNN